MNDDWGKTDVGLRALRVYMRERGQHILDMDLQLDDQDEHIGPWVIVYPQNFARPYCILKHTGNVYRQHSDGAVEDDPLIVITPKGETDADRTHGTHHPKKGRGASKAQHS